MMLKANQILRIATSALAFSAGALALPALSSAQQAAAPAQAAPAPAAWNKTCTKQQDTDLCIVQNIVRAQNGQVITAVGLITIEGKANRKLLQISVPSARLIPPGVVMQIDGGKGQKIDYAICVPDTCTAETPLTDAMVAALKKGNEVVFTSTNFRQAPNPIKISLQGFTSIFDGPPTPQDEIAQTQRALEESMQRKSEQTRRELEEAQKAAIQGQ